MAEINIFILFGIWGIDNFFVSLHPPPPFSFLGATISCFGQFLNLRNVSLSFQAILFVILGTFRGHKKKMQDNITQQ